MSAKVLVEKYILLDFCVARAAPDIILAQRYRDSRIIVINIC
jgi:hypothetical protein